MVKCPKCEQEVEFFLRKPRSPWIACPNCKAKLISGNVPRENVKVVDKYPWETREVKAEEGAIEGEEMVESKEIREKEVRESLFEPPKEVSEIVAEILTEYGCAEAFVKAVTKYIERKGYLDPQWLFNMLLRARTGRRFTEEEAYLVVDEIVSAIEAERKKAESLGKPFGFFVTPFHQPSQYTYHPVFTHPITATTTAPQVQHIPQPSPPVVPPQIHVQPSPPPPPPPTALQPPTLQPALTRDEVLKAIREEVSKLLAEKKTMDEIGELRRKITEEIPKQVEEKLEKQRAEVINMLKESIKELKDAITSISASISKPTVSEEEITKKDLELMRERLEKEMLSKVHEAEKKVLEERLKAIEAKIEEKKQPIIPPSSEGYKEDGYRLVADAIKTLVKPGEWYPGRAVSEVLIKVVPVYQQPPEGRRELKVPGEKSIIDQIKEAGGIVE